MKFVSITAIVCLTVISSVVSIAIPSPPEILDVDCKRRSAILSWSPTGEQTPTEFKIQYTTNWNQNQWFDYGFTEPLRVSNVRLILSPWANYTFRVISLNHAGASNVSGVSESCSTEEDIPHKNPTNVYGRGNGPKNLVISWDPMPPIEQNAPGFFYTVFWRLNDDQSAGWHHKHVLDWQINKLVIENLPKLRPYRIKVEAHNSLGRAQPDPTEVIGFSDEDRPSQAPDVLKLVKIRDGKSALLKWTPVPPLSLNGHFKGYKVQVWTDSYENRTEQIVGANITTALIDIFTPGKTNNAQVLAFNGAFAGPASNSIKLDMPVDVYPDPPAFIWTRVTDQSNKAVIRIEYEPNMTNSNPGQKIYIQYRRKDMAEEWQSTVKEDIEEETQTNDLINLDFDIFYEIRVGVDSGNLSVFSNISAIDTSSKKWPKPTTTTTLPPPTQPPTRPLYIQQSKDSENPNTFDERVGVPDGSGSDNKGLGTGDHYGVDTGEDESGGSSKAAWIIGLVCVLAFICAFVGVFIFLKRRKTGGTQVNSKSRVKMDKIRTTTMTAINHSTDQNERNSFINVDNRLNGNAGHDEGDDHEDDGHQNREVYNGTTQRIV